MNQILLSLLNESGRRSLFDLEKKNPEEIVQTLPFAAV